jgi:hypothetical protein
MSAARFPSLVAASTRIEAGLGFISRGILAIAFAMRLASPDDGRAPERPFFQVIDRLDILV